MLVCLSPTASARGFAVTASEQNNSRCGSTLPVGHPGRCRCDQQQPGANEQCPHTSETGDGAGSWVCDGCGVTRPGASERGASDSELAYRAGYDAAQREAQVLREALEKIANTEGNIHPSWHVKTAREALTSTDRGG